MGDIVPFDGRHPVKKQNISSGVHNDSFRQADAEFETAAERLMESGGEEELAEFLRAMGGLAGEALKNPHVKEVMDKADELYQEFKRRNRDVIDNAPKFDAGLRMQYYAEVMLGLADRIFHTEDGFSQPFDDFADFMNLYNLAFSKYSEQYSDLEEEYHFTGELTYDVAELERMVMECLKEVVRLRPNESDRDKTRLLYHGSRLFEVYRNMLYYHTDVL